MAEKEYVLGNKTKDLLVYTFTVTKPIGDKTMDINEVVKILRTIKELPEAEREAFIIEVIDSMNKSNSKQGFPKSAVYTYAKTIRETAVLILRNIHAANDCNFQTEYERRIDLIHAALQDCNLMLKLVEISQALGYISMKRMEHWTKLITDVKYMTLAWKKKDTQRAREIARQEQEKDYRLQATIISQAVGQAVYQAIIQAKGRPPSGGQPQTGGKPPAGAQPPKK
jgi:hypothetical protein